MRRFVLGCLVFSLLFSTTAGLAEHRVVAPPGTSLGLPFSPGILADDFLFLSGAIGNLPNTTDTPGDAAEQMQRTFDNLSAVLKAAELDFANVVDLNMYLADGRHFPAVLGAYSAAFGESAVPPTGAVVQADIAIPAALTEVSMVAARPGVEVRRISPEGWAAPKLPFSWGVLAGDTLFVAGMISFDPVADKVVPGDVGSQTRLAMKNLGAVLEAAGMDFDDVVYCGVFLADARGFAAMNEAYQSVFTAAPPARATVRASLVSPELAVAVHCRASRAERKAVLPPGAKPSKRLSPAIQAGDRLFLSGMVGRQDGQFPAGIEAQTRVVFDRLKATLTAAGMSFADVEEAAVFLTDIRHYAAMNKVYAEIVGTPPPARATVGTQLMSPDALVEIRMTASRKTSARQEENQ